MKTLTLEELADILHVSRQNISHHYHLGRFGCEVQKTGDSRTHALIPVTPEQVSIFLKWFKQHGRRININRVKEVENTLGLIN
jgi:hypothetical protein